MKTLRQIIREASDSWHPPFNAPPLTYGDINGYGIPGPWLGIQVGGVPIDPRVLQGYGQDPIVTYPDGPTPEQIWGEGLQTDPWGNPLPDGWWYYPNSQYNGGQPLLISPEGVAWQENPHSPGVWETMDNNAQWHQTVTPWELDPANFDELGGTWHPNANNNPPWQPPHVDVYADPGGGVSTPDGTVGNIGGIGVDDLETDSSVGRRWIEWLFNILHRGT